MLQHGKGHHEPSPLGEMALAALQLAHGFNDNGAAPTTIAAAPGTILATVTVTPKVSGKFKLSASVVVHNTEDTAHTVGLQFGHGGLADYPATVNPVSVPTSANVFVGLEAETGSAGPYVFVAPLGSPVTFDLIATANVAGVLEADAHGAQLTVEELPN